MSEKEKTASEKKSTKKTAPETKEPKVKKVKVIQCPECLNSFVRDPDKEKIKCPSCGERLS